MGETFTLTFYGTRGTRTVSGAQFTRFGGHTTCVAVQAGDRTIIFDSGSGIISLGKSLVQNHFAAKRPGPVQSYIFHTHAHYDHIAGLPYFLPLYVANTTTWIYGPRNPTGSFEETIRSFIRSPLHPIELHEMAGEKVWGEVAEPDAFFFVRDQAEPVRVRPQHAHSVLPPADQIETVVRCMRGYNHPKCGVMIYRIEHAGRSITFATDVEGYVLGDQRLIAFARDSHVLIHDAMYTRERYASSMLPTQGWGHSTLEIATDAAQQANAQHLYLIHHDPDHDDDELERMEKVAQARFSSTTAARDGLTIDMIASYEPTP